MGDSEQKRSVSFEGAVQLDEALAYLKSLQTAMKKGSVYVRNGVDVIALEPKTDIWMEVEARTKKEKQSIKLALSWESVDGDEEPATEHFDISSTAPELVDVADEE